MHGRTFRSLIGLAAGLLALLAGCHHVPSAALNTVATVDPSFLVALDAADAAQRDLQSGHTALYKSIWSHSDDATLIGGFGGGVEKGWSNVSKRIDWVASQFSNGTNTIERQVTRCNGSLGYAVQIERIRFQVPGQSTESTRDYRVTMLFVRESDGWRLMHRHADSQMMRQAPK
jgi:ketosteroid isomerase-like protein